MKTRLQRFTSALPKLLLLLLLTGMEECGGCDDIGLLNVRNADTTCLGIVRIRKSDLRTQYVSAGDTVSFFVDKGNTGVQTVFASRLSCEDCSSLDDFKARGEPDIACACLSAGNPGRTVGQLKGTDAYLAYHLKQVVLNVDPEANTVLYCDESQSPAVVVVEPDVGQGPL